jgi:hypothetical protein
VTSCQRWRARRDTYRPAGEPIRPSDYGVELLPGDKAARAFVEAHHYSGSYPAARCRVGLYRRALGPAPSGVELVGVAVFSVPMQARAIPARCGVGADEGVELGRFVLLDSVEANGETWFLSRAFRALRGELPAVRAVLSYSDPVPREDAQGRRVMPGHVGTIYQALGATYHGRAAARTLRLDDAGRVVSERALSKLRNGEVGRGYAMRLLIDAGAPPPGEGEDPRAWAEAAVARLRAVRHPGNHTYTWDLNGPRGNHSGIPYPKRRDGAQLDIFGGLA